MGTSVGLVGPISGKIGTMVWYYRNGKQHQRVYISNPNNPKSTAQQLQRMKMALAGRLSKIVQDTALEGFDGSKTDRRSAFLRNVLLSTQSTEDGASIPFQSVVFSTGSLGVMNGHTVSAGSSSPQQRALNITASHGSTEEPLPVGYGERYVVLCLNEETSQFDYCATGLLNMPEEGSTSAQTLVVFRVGDKVNPYTAVVYVVPFIAAQAQDGVDYRYTYLGTEDGTIVIDVVTGEQLGRPQVFGQSQFVGTLSLPQPNSKELAKGSK